MFSAFLKQMPEHLLYPGPEFSQENTVVNYLWINAVPYAASGPGDSLCGVPLNALDKAYDNACRYPDTKFILWVDYSRMDQMSRFWVESHHYVTAPGNIELRDLSKLPAYTDASARLADDKSTTRRPDLARLHVMQECLKTMKDKTYAMYCDLDVEDVRIGCPKSQRILAQHGMVHSYIRSLHEPKREKILGLGYLLFRNDVGPNFLDRLIRQAEHNVITGQAPDICPSLHKMIGEWLAKTRHTLDDVIHPDTLLHPIGYDIPHDPFYEECGINF
ncbi:MAG: hypothetical protein LRZ85_00250 [Alphaproteobacteria bacterium]|nr:hypothetical protein [Alphaproteobacteria bacterium]